MLAEAEARVQALEKERGEIEAALADPALFHDPRRWQEATDRHAALESEIARAWASWEETEAAASP